MHDAYLWGFTVGCKGKVAGLCETDRKLEVGAVGTMILSAHAWHEHQLNGVL